MVEQKNWELWLPNAQAWLNHGPHLNPFPLHQKRTTTVAAWHETHICLYTCWHHHQWLGLHAWLSLCWLLSNKLPLSVCNLPVILSAYWRGFPWHCGKTQMCVIPFMVALLLIPLSSYLYPCQKPLLTWSEALLSPVSIQYINAPNSLVLASSSSILSSFL